MKSSKLVTICILSIFAYILISINCINKSNAAITIKPGEGVQTYINVNNSFLYCRDLKLPTGSLGLNTLDPHLAKPTDWGAAAYLGLSSYGGVTNKEGTTVVVMLDDVNAQNYASINGNQTGVLNFGTTVTQTAGYLEGTTSNTANSLLYDTNNSRYVNVISTTNDAEHTRGMAYAETAGWYWGIDWGNTVSYPDSARPIGLRTKVIGYWAGGGGNNYSSHGNGDRYNNVTYRPVIWN